MLTTSIQKLEKEPGGNVQIPLEGLKSTWTEVSGTLDGQKALFQARKSHTEKGYKIELRREYSEWYAYPFDVMATAITPFDAAKNFTITYSGLILYGIIHPLFSPFFDVSFPIVLLNPTGY